MSDESGTPPEEDFSLFDTEKRVLADAETMIRQLHEVARGVQKLADAYRRSYREQQRLVRLSDRMQHELQMTKRELAEQANDLLALNEVLRSEAEQRVKLSDELFRMATTDPLTGTATRRHLFELGNYEISKRARTGEPLTALMIDLDHFKRINDTYGHIAGDEVLKRFAEICRTVIRNSDIFARYGGEEFVILLPGTAERRGVDIAERLRAAVEEGSSRSGESEIAFTISIGLVALNDQEISLEELLVSADNALYEAKRRGRDQVVVGTITPMKSPRARDAAG